MPLTLNRFNPYAATHRPCDVTPEMMASFKVPLTFPFFHDEARELVHQPTFRWLASHSLSTFEINRRWDESAAVNRAYAMQQFLDVTSTVGCEFEEGSAGAFRLFGDGLLNRINERTGDHLSSDYMSRLARYVAEGYAYTNAAGYTSVDLDADAVILALSDDDLDIPEDGAGFGVRLRRQIRRKAMTEDEWKSVAAELGPLLTSGWAATMPSMRPRLTGEWGLQVGTRVAETADLPADDVMAIRLEPHDVEGHVTLTLTETKGRWVRDAIVPKTLIHASQYYHGTERRMAMDVLKSRVGAAFVESRSLFVNDLGSTGAGRSATSATIQSDLRAAVRAAMLCDPVKIPVRGGGTIEVWIPRFTYHSLRHTFAVWLYHARKFRLGDPEPWLYIRARLGHRHLSTTLDSYLDLGRMLEPQIGRIIRDTFHAALDWPISG